MNKKVAKTLYGGLTENPVFVLVLGMCPVVGTTNLKGALILGIATCFVLIFSNLLISSLRKLIPDKVRIPCYIIIIATLVTVVDMVLGGILPPQTYIGVRMYIALIVVNCIVLGRAESFASQNPPHLALLDGASMGVGFILSLSLYGGIREILSSGKLFGVSIFPDTFAIKMFGQASGGLILLGLMMALFNFIYTLAKKSYAKKHSIDKFLSDREKLSADSGDDGEKMNYSVLNAKVDGAKFEGEEASV